MLLEDRPFELLLGAGPNDGAREASRIRDFVRRCLAQNVPGFRERADASNDDGTNCECATACAPIESRTHSIVFDIEALIARKNVVKAAILSPLSVQRALSYEPRRSALAHMARYADIQQSLLSASTVLLLRADQLLPLSLLGACAPIALASPAIARPQPGAERCDILVIDHLHEARTLALVTTGLAEKSFSVAVLDPTFAGDGEFPDARLHVHLGAAAHDDASLRIVDSHAQGAPVVLLDDRNPQALAPVLRVEHNVSGIWVHRPRDVPAAAERLLRDPAMADLFCRNGERIAAGFDAAIAARIVSAVA